MKNHTITSAVRCSIADQADRAVRQLYGDDAPLTRQITQITNALRHDIQRIRDGQSAGTVSLALVGKVGEGKSWLMRCFLISSFAPAEVMELIQSGQNAAERSMELIWVGAEQPFAQLSPGERFIRVSPQALLDLGASYIIADSPGFSDHDPTLESLSSIALASANIKLLATSVANIRDASLSTFIHSMDGSLIQPLIRFRPEGDSLEPSPQTRADCEAEIQRWQQHAPAARILPALYIPDAGIAGEEAARSHTRQLLSAALTPLLEDPAALARHQEAQLQQRIQLAQKQLAAALAEFRQRIGSSVETLDQLAASLPETIQTEVIGEPAQLRIGIRSRFRADAIERTPSLFFPYRSLIGILGLTQGAWDRLVFTTLGSVPSLVITAFHSIKNWKNSKNFESNLRDQARQRIRSLVNDAYRDDIKNFSHALDAIIPESAAISEQASKQENTNLIDIQGLTGLEIEAQNIISESIKKHRISSFILWLGGLLAVGVFWTMLLGPAIALYTDYFHALKETAQSVNPHWDNYPKPPASLWLTSFMISLLPAALISMVIMVLTTRNGRLKKTSADIEQEISNNIRQRIQEGKLRLIINDPKLNAAKTLLGISSVNDEQ